ncbi:MAG: KH domain-containing protein, partial [Bacilli bacterium]
MDKKIFFGKTKEEAINNALIELQEEENNLYIKEVETKTSLFKAKKVEIEVVTKSEIIEFTKEYIQKLVHNMGITANMELKNHDGNITITLYSDNNALLIGKQGRTMESLSIVVKQAIYTKYGFYFNFVLDVGEYKVKQE